MESVSEFGLRRREGSMKRTSKVEEKPLHVVFKYLQKSALERVGEGGVMHPLSPLLISKLIRGYIIKKTT
jgi:hypothetical protein